MNKFCAEVQNKGMRKIKDNALGKTPDERESCFSECGAELCRPEGKGESR